VGGFGASFSSGYGFALGSGNNYGMFSSTGSTTSLGSVPVHTYSGGGDLADNPENQNGAGTGSAANPSNGPMPPPNFGLDSGPQGPNYWNRLLGKNPAGADSLITRPVQTNP
jgi:hypothetical protein